MGQALYRKHRPKRLSEVVGQEHITKTLEQALKQGRISHAYLFTGPKGVGKTSIARIWAHEINGIPYSDDSSHMDIIEIDAASNRRIDEIRELRDKVYMAPTSAKYKVYIIDEVHMLTREAFNALLKTLEEPPAHVVFILATTDAHKLPETIISRTQRYSFRPVDRAKVVGHLRDIAKKEKIDVTDDALTLLADHGEGSFRDSISMLDQANNQGETLSADVVQRLLGVPSTEAVSALLNSVWTSEEASDTVQALNTLYDQGYQGSAIAKQLGQRIRSLMLDNSLPIASDVALRLLERLLGVAGASDQDRYLEIILLQSRTHQSSAVAAVTPKPPTPVKAEPPLKTAESPEKKTVTKSPAEKPEEPAIELLLEEAPPAASVAPSAAENQSTDFDQASWASILQLLKQRHNTLYGVVRMAQPSTNDEGGLRLAFAFAFHQKRINEASNRQKLVDVIQEATGQNITIECVVDKTAQAPAVTGVVTVAPVEAPNISAISNIFGGGELLES